jgi:mitochondrial import receptor subunit TOM70
MTSPPPAVPVGTPLASTITPPTDSTTWDRISTWVSEHKAVVYTIAGVAIVVTGAGVAYYATQKPVSSSQSRANAI